MFLSANMSIFENFFDIYLHSTFLKLVGQNTPLRDVYIKIRRLYPKEFRSALMSFIRKHPNSTMYDKIDKKKITKHFAMTEFIYTFSVI